MNFNNYPVLKILLFYVLGIITAYFTRFSKIIPLIFLAFLFLLWLLSKILYNKTGFNNKWIPTLMVQFCFFFSGFLLTGYRLTSRLPAEEKGEKCRIVKVIDNPVIKNKSIKIIAQWVDYKEKILFYVSRDSLSEAIECGDVLFVFSDLREILPPDNPNAFDYQQFMKKKGIFNTGYVRKNGWRQLDHSHHYWLKNNARNIQQIFASLFASAGMQGDEYGIILAILLGNDDTLDPALKTSYAAAGVSHILCVSGMHVGIIFMILNFLLKPLEYNRHTRFLKWLLLLLTMWFYANITGLSPSVSRAATMFSFVSVGSLLKRNTNIFHSLYTSLFILLIINPLLLFELGFQLSYLAVFGIVVFQKPMASLWHCKTKAVIYLWQLITVSVAAQLTTAPIAMLYFGQFPNYFLLSNLSVISLSFVIVISGVVTLFISWIPSLAQWAALLLTYEIKLMNKIITTIEALPFSVTENICLSCTQTLLLYAAIAAVAFLLLYKNKKMWWLFLSTLLVYSFSTAYQKWENQHTTSVTCYHLAKNTAINFNRFGKSILLTDSIMTKQHPDYQYSIKNHERMKRIKSNIVPISTPVIDNNLLWKKNDFIGFNGKRYCYYDKKQRLHPTSHRLKVDYLIISKKNLKQLASVNKAIVYEEIVVY